MIIKLVATIFVIFLLCLIVGLFTSFVVYDDGLWIVRSALIFSLIALIVACGMCGSIKTTRYLAYDYNIEQMAKDHQAERKTSDQYYAYVEKMTLGKMEQWTYYELPSEPKDVEQYRIETTEGTT